MNKFKFTASLYLATVFILFTTCDSTKVVSSWGIDNPPQGSMNKVLVIGMMGNRVLKDHTEMEMVRQLNTDNVDAATSTSVFGPKGFNGLTEEQITNKLKDSDFTSVMIVSLFDKEKEKNYTPGNTYTTPRIAGYSRYYKRYIVVYDKVYTPGYYTTSTNYILNADIYAIDNDTLLYSAQTESHNPNTLQALAESFAKAISKELKVKGLIPYYSRKN